MDVTLIHSWVTTGMCIPSLVLITIPTSSRNAVVLQHCMHQGNDCSLLLPTHFLSSFPVSAVKAEDIRGHTTTTTLWHTEERKTWLYLNQHSIESVLLWEITPYTFTCHKIAMYYLSNGDTFQQFFSSFAVHMLLIPFQLDSSWHGSCNLQTQNTNSVHEDKIL